MYRKRAHPVQGTNAEERRKATRFLCHIPAILIKDSEKTACSIESLSIEGIGILLSRPNLSFSLRDSDVVLLELPIEYQRHGMYTVPPCRIVYLQDVGTDIWSGLRLEKPTRNQRELLKELIHIYCFQGKGTIKDIHFAPKRVSLEWTEIAFAFFFIALVAVTLTLTLFVDSLCPPQMGPQQASHEQTLKRIMDLPKNYPP